MEQKFNLKKGQKETVLLFAPNGGVTYTFDGYMFTDIRTIRGASINLVKVMREQFDEKDVVILKDDTGNPHNCCPQCGGTNVELKSWVSEKDGYISDPEVPTQEDAWCQDCEKHIEPDLSTESFILYNSTEKK